MRSKLGWLLAGLAAVAAACSAPANAPVKLAPVAALPKPVLPAWISSISPTQSAQTLAQVRVIFAKPVAKLAALSGDGPRDVLDRVTISPALKGHFAVLTPRMLAFVPEQALPVGTRVQVTLRAGLRDLDGDTLGQDLAWTFETDALSFSDLPQAGKTSDDSTPSPVGVRPKIPVTANAAVDPESLAAHTAFVGDGESVPVTVKLEAQPTPPPGAGAAELFDPSLKTWVYDLTPQRDLHLARTYTIAIDPGVEPAYGNAASAQRFLGAVHTYDPLAILMTPLPEPGNGTRFDKGDPAIPFNNPLDPKSIAGAVGISPAPANVKGLTTLSDDATTILIDPYALDPNTTYTFTVAPSVKDVFGQTLGRSQTMTADTGNFKPGAWAPQGTSVIPAGAAIALNFYATNVPGNTYRAAYARVSPPQMFGYPDPLTILPDSKSWPQHVLAGARVNAQSVVRVPLQAQLGGPFGALAYGFRTALDPDTQQPGISGIAQLTNLGVFGEFFPQRGMVLVQHLSDGAAAPGVAVTVYRNLPGGSGTQGAPIACARATTDAGGEADFGGVDLERCYAGNGGTDAPTLGIVATQGTDAATLTLSGYSGLYRFNVTPGWSSGAPLSRGTIFSDRMMYQPGESGRITGIAYYVRGPQVIADRNAAYRVTLTDPNNAVTHLPNVTTDAYGVFSLPVTFSKQQALGYYTIEAKGSSGNDITGSLRVAEFKPPNFKLTLDLSAPSAAAGGTIAASATAAYLFGAPLQGGNLHAYVTREAATVAPKGWDEYWFGRQWFWPEDTPSFDSDVLQRDVPLDAQGKAGLNVSVPGDLPFPMTYTVDMEATDVSNLSVADSKTFLALPSDATIGLASDSVVGAAGKPMTIHTIVTDAAGKPIAGRAIHVELQKMTYTSATQQVEGGESAQQAVEYRTVSTADATSGDKPVDVTVTPDDSGAYRVRATFNGAKSDASATDIQVFAFGSGEADWGGSDPTVVTVKLDKKSYAVGDTATALVASPFDRSDVYVTVVRGDALYRTTLHDVHGAARVSFRVTEAMLPNAAVQAVVVRRGASLATLKPGSLDTLARTGMTAFDVDTAGRYLKLGIAPHAATVAPGAQQRVEFTLDTKNGTPAQGEIVAMVVNDAILQLSGYRPPDLVATVFADQPISALLGDSRDGVVLKTQMPPVEKGFGYGGGYLAGAASTRVRKQFLPLAYYGVLKTGANGRAGVSFKLPDDLTTWRVMAVAIGQDDAHFAGADATFVSSLPLMLNPLLPQFARTGDTFDLGASLSNQTGAGGALALVMKLGGALAFSSGDPHAQTVPERAATGMQAFRFGVTAGTPAPTDVSVSGKLGTFGDAFSVPFTVSNAAVTESVIESGAVRNGEAKIPIDVAAGGNLRLTLANSVVPQFAGPTARMMSQDGLPLADETSSRLTIAAALARLRGPYRLSLDFDPAAESAKDAA
ncbi:MAG TPA: Ig-like domain-containing protein, partial [Candidatus Tumulicola sp.]|nr:Ig-like domain-containing protein [Candidatus Tumulicola sp.]